LQFVLLFIGQYGTHMIAHAVHTHKHTHTQSEKKSVVP